MAITSIHNNTTDYFFFFRDLLRGLWLYVVGVYMPSAAVVWPQLPPTLPVKNKKNIKAKSTETCYSYALHIFLSLPLKAKKKEEDIVQDVLLLWQGIISQKQEPQKVKSGNCDFFFLPQKIIIQLNLLRFLPTLNLL